MPEVPKLYSLDIHPAIWPDVKAMIERTYPGLKIVKWPAAMGGEAGEAIESYFITPKIMKEMKEEKAMKKSKKEPKHLDTTREADKTSLIAWGGSFTKAPNVHTGNVWHTVVKRRPRPAHRKEPGFRNLGAHA